MKNQALLLLFASLVPLFTALVGTIIEILSLQDSVTVREKQVKRMLMCYFAVFILIGSGVSTGLAIPVVSVWLWPATVFSLYMAPVLYYRFIVLLTRTGRKDSPRYSGHYLLPFAPLVVRLQLFQAQGLATLEGGRWRLTPRGFLMSNSILVELLEVQEHTAPLAKRR